VTKRELYSHGHYVQAGYAYFRLAILRTIQFCIIYVNVQKGVLYSGSTIYSHLPLNIKTPSKDTKQFKSTLRSYLIEHIFYSLDECYQLTSCSMVLTQYIINLIIFLLSFILYINTKLYCDKCFALFCVRCVTDSISVKTYGRWINKYEI